MAALLVAIGLALGALRNPRWASGALSVLVLVTIVWQLIGFGYLNVATTGNGLLLAALLALLLAIYFFSARLGPASMALAIMAVSLMLTPYYYLSIALIVAAAAVGGLSSIGPVSSTFISTLIPFLVIENGIYLSGAGPGSPPIVFSYLSEVSANLTPALPGLNVFLTGLPTNILSPYSSVVIQFINSGRADILVVPILLLGLVFSASASLAGLFNSSVGRLSAILKTSSVVDVLGPLVGGLVTSVTFAVLIIALATPALGGYQTSLSSSTDDLVLLLISSLLVGLIFTGRELAVRRMERLELARSRLSSLLSAAKSTIANSSAMADIILQEAPTADVKPESRILSENESLVSDIQRGLDTASYETLTRWSDDLGAHVLPSMAKMPEALRIKVINELTSLHALITAYNNILAEARATNRFPSLLPQDGTISIDEAVRSYQQVTTGIKESASNLFEEYQQAAGAYSQLMNREESTPPVNASYLFDSGDYVTGMKLIAEEYWSNFRATCREEMEEGISAVAVQATRLEGLLNEGARDSLRQLVNSLADAEPAHSVAYKESMEKMLLLLRGEVERWRDDAERLERLIKSLTPGATKVISFESLDQSGKLRELYDRLGNTKASLVNMAKFMDEAADTLSTHRDKVRIDERSLIMLSQYPVAKRLIERRFKSRKQVPIAELPFQHDAAAVFVKLFSMTHKRASFDYGNEELVSKDA